MSSSTRRKRTGEKKPDKDEDKTDVKVLKIGGDNQGKDVPPLEGDSETTDSSLNLKHSETCTSQSSDKGQDRSDDCSNNAEQPEIKSPYFSKKIKDLEELDEASVEDLDGDEDQVSNTSKRLSQAFYEQSCEDLAKALLGQVLVRIHNGERLAGKIIETESYLGRRDKAAHSYKGKTDRNTAMFMDPGTAYVYNIYGMYCCMNISSQGEGEAVLIRSLEPLEGKPVMTSFRSSNRKKVGPSSKPMKERDLCNGPSKLTQALNIDKKSVNQVDLTSNDIIWLERGEPVPSTKMVVSKRINIAYAEEWTDKPLRFYELGNPCVSVKDKEVEKQMKQT